MKLSRFLLLLPILLLSSCLLPEKFTSKLHVTKDYGYTFEYDGLIAYGPALAEIAKNGSLPKNADNDLRQSTANNFKKEDGYERATYEGNGRWKVHFKKRGQIVSTTKLLGDGLPIVTLQRANDGTVSIEGITFDDKVVQEIKEVNCVIDGQLEITTDMTVVRHNATETPKLRGLFGSYKWKISTAKLISPSMTLRP